MSNFQQISTYAEAVKSEIKGQNATVILYTSYFQEYVAALEEVKTVSMAELGGHFKDSSISLSLRSLNGREIFFCGPLPYYRQISDLGLFNDGIRFLKLLGFKHLHFIADAQFVESSLECNLPLIVSDHINMTTFNPLIGANDEKFGLRFPDMSEAYNRDLIKNSAAKIRQAGLEDRRVIAAVVTTEGVREDNLTVTKSGAEVRINSIAAEVIVAVHSGLDCSALVFVPASNSSDAKQLINNKLNAIHCGI